MDKGKLHHYYHLLKRLKVWPLVGLCLVLAIISAVALRQNNLGMVERRRAVLAADKQNGDVEGTLKELGNYVLSHMNTRMSEPLQLKYSYERAVKQQVAKAAKSGTPTDSEAYLRAQRECQTVNTVTYAQCVIDKTSKVAPGSDPITQLTPPSPALFSYSFYSPVWSPDLAGFAVLGLIATLLLLIFRIVGERIAKLILSRHQ